jgi:hypothetical protein
MTRVVSVGRSSKGLISAGALGLVLAAVALTGCPGSLDDPGAFPPPVTGAAGAGNTSGAAGTGAAGTGAAGTGAAGTGAAGTGAVAGCDVSGLIGNGTAATPGKYFCTTQGVCHDSAGSAAGLDLASANLAARLVGIAPKGGGAVTPSVCAADANFKTMPYITKSSPTGAGLLLMKLQAAICAPGGMQMPTLNGPLSATDLACFKSWATALANQ